jgi:hypothetical protein
MSCHDQIATVEIQVREIYFNSLTNSFLSCFINFSFLEFCEIFINLLILIQVFESLFDVFLLFNSYLNLVKLSIK